MLNGVEFDDIKICNDLVIDGHHRNVSALLAKKEIGNVPTNQTSATKQYDWKNVEFVSVEWDTKEKIEKLNREDAATTFFKRKVSVNKRRNWPYR